MGMLREEAIAWLPLRPGARRVTVEFKDAREALLVAAGPDRRRHQRLTGAPRPDARLSRRSTWGLESADPWSVDMRL